MQRLYEQVGTKKYDGSLAVSERHRHRFEVNPTFVSFLENHGLVFSGHHVRHDGTYLMEYLEVPHHPFFVGDSSASRIQE